MICICVCQFFFFFVDDEPESVTVAFSGGAHNTVRNGNPHTRSLHGTGTNNCIDTHFNPKQRITCDWLERTASR